ncbi:hypothetical protein I5S53_04410 [Pseudomonas juntendi]|uniref:hypothetical protein n=1 Tax=Pseudomonas TaxID=286 RepID=UPI001269B314|nr:MULTISPECIES: hypothetical protein [Pseudomonas]MBH3383219.1 hypothetical protein [Pseudomonas juntendi]
MKSFSVDLPNLSKTEMLTRAAIQAHIRSAGEEVSRWRAWGYKAPSDPTPLLREHTPSGYEDWFVVEKGKAIWWVYSNSSDGGSWSSEGIKITGFRIDFDESIAQNIYELVYQTITAETPKQKNNLRV